MLRHRTGENMENKKTTEQLNLILEDIAKRLTKLEQEKRLGLNGE